MECWEEFNGKDWKNSINVSDFIKNNVTEYLEDESFLENISDKTKKLLEFVEVLLNKELKNKVLEIDTSTFSGINNYKPGYILKECEVIVGLQTDKPLKRIVNPYGGIRMVKESLKAYNKKIDEDMLNNFSKYRKTHNEGVFDAYTKEMRIARKAGLLTGLPDSYGRGRIIGDYRRIALYGIDFLEAEKIKDLEAINMPLDEEKIRLREEVNGQIKALEEIKIMAQSYFIDISKPASNAKEAVQWLYFGYLAAVKENNGAAMSLGRCSTFLDIYINRDLKKDIISEVDAQELIDQFVIKLRLVRHLRTPNYDELFSGDPTWVTEAIGGMLDKKHSLVTKTSYRFLHTLINLKPSPEPNLTILWSKYLPDNFKKYCAKISIQTNALQYENDDLMRPLFGNDYAIACCVSAMQVGKQMQYFGARCNLAKALLYSLNGGVDEITNLEVIKGFSKNKEDILNYKTVIKNYAIMLDEVAKIYANTMNVIHYMHDKYAYEYSEMALHDTKVSRLMAFGVAGLSVVVDSLSAIKYAKVYPIRNKEGLIISYKIEGDYPKFGNDDDRVDKIACEVLKYFYEGLKFNKLYREAIHTLSVLTITSNIVYGKKTGATPDGRIAFTPFAPGANPMHQRDIKGALASLNSVAKLDYSNYCQDGISNTFSIIPTALGANKDEGIDNLVTILTGYFNKGGHHLNVNILNKEMLIDASNNPEKYPLLTIRVSGYAVRFNRLTKIQQQEVINRTFHEKI